jgi:hypothetical protein
MNLADKKFVNARQFSQAVEENVDDFDGSYMDTILWLLEERGIEIDSAKKLLLGQIREKLASEAESKNQIKKVNKLPV